MTRSPEKASPQSQPELPFVGLDAIAPHTMTVAEMIPFGSMKSLGSHFRAGDVLYGRLRPYLNKVWHADREGACSGELLVLRTNGKLDPRFLAYRLHSRDFVDYASHAVTGDRPRLDFKQLAAFRTSLPPVEVQRRIVARIDELFSELDDGEEELRRARAELDTYRKSLLKAAVTGELTADWRAANPPKESGADLLQRILADRRARWEVPNKGKQYKEPLQAQTNDLPKLPDAWVWASIDQLSVRVTKGSSPGWQGFDYQDDGILFVRSQNVGWGDLRLFDQVYLDPKFNEVERKAIVRSGDVLLNIVGASIGRACKADQRLDGANTNQAVAGIRPVTAALSDHLVSWLVSPGGQSAIFKNVVETARANLSLEDVRGIAVPLPPLDEMTQIEMALAAAELTGSEVFKEASDAEEASAALRQSILAAAFRGELVQ